MNTKTFEAVQKYLSELTANSLIDIVGLVTIEDIDFNNAYQSIYDMIDDNGGFNVEVIYYSDALDYLMNNDPSLRDSLSIAANCGYSVERLNSEILASLLASQQERKNFENLESQINSFFAELEN